MDETSQPAGGREPMFNLPAVVVWTVLALVGVQLLREFGGREVNFYLITRFAYFPAAFLQEGAPYGTGGWWTPATSFFLHAGWQHLLMNALWLVVFGSAVAWRFGPVRFVLLALLTAAAGSLVHGIAHPGEMVPLVGASGGVSGLTAAAARFVFAAGGPLGSFRPRGGAVFRAPAPPFLAAVTQPTALAFILVWFALNFVFGALGIAEIGGEAQRIAWEAHAGGFLAGLVLFTLLDPIGPRRRPAE